MMLTKLSKKIDSPFSNPAKLMENLSKAKAILFETLLIPSIVTLTSILKCGNLQQADDNSHLYLVKMGCCWQCYDAAHIVSLIVILPVTCLISWYVYQYETSKSQFEDVFILMISFRVLDITFEILSAGIISFYEEYAAVIITFTLLAAVGMESIVIYFQPCLGSGRYLNVHFASVYAVIIWTAICSLISVIPEKPVIGLPEILFFIGVWPIVYAARKNCMLYAHKRDEEMFEQCKVFMDPIKTAQQRKSEKNLKSKQNNNATLIEMASQNDSKENLLTNLNNTDINAKQTSKTDKILTVAKSDDNVDDVSNSLQEDPLQARINATKDALTLSLVAEYHSRLLQLILKQNGEIITNKILNNPKCDDEYKILILKILTNIANMNGDLRADIIRTPGMIDVLLKINKSTQSSLVTVTYPRAALGVLCNISVHSAMYDVVNKKILLEIVKNTESSVDYALRLFASSIILNLVKGKKPKKKESTEKTSKDATSKNKEHTPTPDDGSDEQIKDRAKSVPKVSLFRAKSRVAPTVEVTTETKEDVVDTAKIASPTKPRTKRSKTTVARKVDKNAKQASKSAAQLKPLFENSSQNNSKSDLFSDKSDLSDNSDKKSRAKSKSSFWMPRKNAAPAARKPHLTGCTPAEIKSWLLEDGLFNRIWWLVTKSNDVKLLIIGLQIIFHAASNIGNVNTLVSRSKWFETSIIEKLRDDCADGTKKFENNQQTVIAQKCESILQRIAKSSGMRKSDFSKSKLKLSDTSNEENEGKSKLQQRLSRVKTKLQFVSSKMVSRTQTVTNSGTMVVNLDD